MLLEEEEDEIVTGDHGRQVGREAVVESEKYLPATTAWSGTGDFGIERTIDCPATNFPLREQLPPRECMDILVGQILRIGWVPAF